MVIRGHREDRGQTAEELDPLQAETRDLLKEFLDIFKQNKKGGKMAWENADYIIEAPFPFQCMTCVSYRSGDVCVRVHGPYESGKVEGQDSCRLWQAGRGWASKEEGDED